MIFRSLDRRGIDYARLDERRLAFDLLEQSADDLYDVVWCRAISNTRATYALDILNAQGVSTVNDSRVVHTCGDKVLTTLALTKHGVPSPRTSVALGIPEALEVMESMGYPVVLKPAAGSWGRLLSRVSDRETAEAVMKHKVALGGPSHGVFYIQEYVDKPARDIRSMVVGDRVIYAMYRQSEHWITNTARGGHVQSCPITPEIGSLSLAAARAVGGGILAVDILETSGGQMLVNEVNHTPEFHGAMQVVDVDIAEAMTEYVLSQIQ